MSIWFLFAIAHLICFAVDNFPSEGKEFIVTSTTDKFVTSNWLQCTGGFCTDELWMK